MKLYQMILCCHCIAAAESAGDDMKIGIIGAGRVGCSLGKYMVEQGLPVAGYFSKHFESSEQAGTFTGTEVFKTLEQLIQACDIICIAVPDDVIGSVWEEIRKSIRAYSAPPPDKGKIVCHFSGSLSSAVFSGIEGTIAVGCSIHPMYAFSDKFTSYRQLNQVIFTMEGDERAVAVMEPLYTGMGNRVLRIRPDRKALYHCSASLASNFVVGLLQFSLELLEECGIPEEEGRELIGPLVRGNVEAVLREGADRALTGPIERGDAHTVAGHLAALGEEDARLYRLLGQKVLTVAERMHPGRDYKEIAELLG